MTKKAFYWLLFTSGLLLILAGIYTVIRLNTLGAFTNIKDKIDGGYTVISSAPGPEALALDSEEGILYFISSAPCADSSIRGGIYHLNLKEPDQITRPFQFEHPIDFHPHGLSYFRDHQEKKYLFTNNHREDGTHAVEIFQIMEADVLKHLETIESTKLTSPNDLVAVGPKQFYLTNDGRSHDRRVRSIDTFLGRKTGNVLYFNGNQFIEFVDNLNFPNGIAYHPPSNQLIVAETLSGQLLFYRLDNNQEIQDVDNFYIGHGVDNISLDDQGNILAAIHPNLLALSRHMNNTSKRSASQIITLSYQTKDRKLFNQHDGSIISGVSAAVKYGNELYLGAVCDNTLIRLTISN